MKLPPIFFILFLIVISEGVSAQAGDSLADKKCLFQMKIIPPAFSFEKPLKNDVSVTGTLGALFLLPLENRPLEQPLGYYFQPVFTSVELRNYISTRESDENTNTSGYKTGAYGGLKVSAYYFAGYYNWMFSAGPMIGYQHQTRKRTVININIGSAVCLADGDIVFCPVGSVSVGLKLNKN